MAEKLVLVSAIDELRKNDTFEDQDWPLHVTIMPWFSMPLKLEQEFIDSIADYAHTVAPVSLFGDKNEFFGTDEFKSIKVRTLRGIAQATLLHTGVLDIVTRYAGEVDSQYIRGMYRPHVTYQQGRAIDEDEKVILQQMQLIRGDATGIRRVENVFHFTEDGAE